MYRVLLSITTILFSWGLTAWAQPSIPIEDPSIPINNQPIEQEPYYTPDSSVKFALQDIQSIPDNIRPYIRYFSLYNIPKSERKTVAQTLSFIVNSLSTRKKLYIPIFVANSDETLVRVNMNDYEWKKGPWEDLATTGSGPRPYPEPYFHYIKDQEIEGKNKTTILAAPWLDTNYIIGLMKYTQSNSPIMRADWFITNASVPPAYYNFLKLDKTVKSFENLIFANETLAKKAKSQHKAVVVTSMVTRNNRTLTRSPTFTGGYYWKSHDSLKSTGTRKYLQNILREKFDATEDIGTLPNGLQAYFLTNGQGERLDKADPDIAIDNIAHDRVVRSGRSCIICHAEGIRPLQDEVRTLNKQFQNRDTVRLLITEEKDAYKVDDLFSSNLDKQIIKDQNLYAEAIGECNGLTPLQNSQQFNEIYNNYSEYLLNKSDICRDCGISLGELEKYIRIYIPVLTTETAKLQDPVFLGLIHNPIRPIRRDQWEESYQNFMILIMGAKAGEKAFFEKNKIRQTDVPQVKEFIKDLENPEEKHTIITVRTATNDTKITLDDSPTKKTGLEREFITPKLWTNKNYFYKIKAVWTIDNTEYTYENNITLSGGMRLFLDMTQPNQPPVKIIHQEIIKIIEIPTKQPTKELVKFNVENYKKIHANGPIKTIKYPIIKEIKQINQDNFYDIAFKKLSFYVFLLTSSSIITLISSIKIWSFSNF